MSRPPTHPPPRRASLKPHTPVDPPLVFEEEEEDAADAALNESMDSEAYFLDAATPQRSGNSSRKAPSAATAAKKPTSLHILQQMLQCELPCAAATNVHSPPIMNDDTQSPSSTNDDDEDESVHSSYWNNKNEPGVSSPMRHRTSFVEESTDLTVRLQHPLVLLKLRPAETKPGGGKSRFLSPGLCIATTAATSTNETDDDHASSTRVLSRPLQVWNMEGPFCWQWDDAEATAVMRASLDDETAISNEVGFWGLGYLWRAALRLYLMQTLDHVNTLRMTRILQFQIHFLTFHEAGLLNTLLEHMQEEFSFCKEEYDSIHKRNTPRHCMKPTLQKHRIRRALRRAFQNRNVSRLIVQALRVRYDFWYHWPTAVVWNRYFDGLGQFPVVGSITRFPATENFPATRNHALASMFRLLLGPGNWLTRVITGGRQGLITDDPNHPAQNLTAESNGFELANRNQYGTHFGRRHTNRFRQEHRLPVDESLVRSFITVPIPTMTNNGVVHTLRQLAKHWDNMLRYQTYGNFAHQRMEQLDPFETLRIHIPSVLITLASLRGRNVWDSQVLGPFMKRLTNLDVEPDIGTALSLVQQLQRTIAVPVTGGIPTVLDPLLRWLASIEVALHRIEDEAKQVFELVASVELGIRLGYDITSKVSWKVPSDANLINAIHHYIIGSKEKTDWTIPMHLVSNALERTTPRDKRTLIELIQKDLSYTRPAQLLIRRVKTLLQREVRRDLLNDAILTLSKGSVMDHPVCHVQNGDWYWLESKKHCELYIYCGVVGSVTSKNNGINTNDDVKHQFRHVASGTMKAISARSNDFRHIRIRPYVPVAEAISRAQKVLMLIELEHGKKFSYNAFMEFHHLRIPLQRLLVVGQMACEVLDNARLNILSEVQQLGRFKSGTQNVEPQNIIVVGAGPGGMMVCLHCTENCLASGGVMKLYEARDSFAKGGSTYERAQIVRLDARWIATMRYHLGTGFEDVFIPASGETDAQLGNTLALQGFVEITIKDLENILHVEVSRFWSRGLISVFTDSRSQFDPCTNALTKFGENLKVGDIVVRKLDPSGLPCREDRSWKVVELLYTKLLDVNDLKVGDDYGVYDRQEQVVLPFRLAAVDLRTKLYHFESLHAGVMDLSFSVHDLPSIYPAGTSMNAHADVHKVVLESVVANSRGENHHIELHMSCIKREKFTLDVGNSHVIEAIGKPHDSDVHFSVTTSEPHGVCCLEGLKVSLGMHNFGEKRWGNGIIDDVRSLNDQNTRIIGDFTKMVRTAPIVELMREIIKQDTDWILHFNSLVSNSHFPELNRLDPVVPKIVCACEWLAENARRFRRSTLQTRFFEVGDNFYLGMEFPREYNQWKTNLVDQLVVSLGTKRLTDNSVVTPSSLKHALAHSIDKLWYYCCLETIRTGDVYNPGARRRVPRLYLINSSTSQPLGNLPAGESFRLADSPNEKYEVLIVQAFGTIVRNVEGYVSSMLKTTLVLRESNLTRSPDGNEESRVALSTFPVRHYVNYRTMRVSDKTRGFVFTFAGDEQASPHFMRYSGLTGACINAMSFSNFIEKAIAGVPFVQRYREFAQETNWSNGEVVQRGTGGNYGEDGFLRPGFSYEECIDYLYSKAVEHIETEQPMEQFLSRDWKIKFAAAIIPRDMEFNADFAEKLVYHWNSAVHRNFLQKVEQDERFRDSKIVKSLRAAGAPKPRDTDKFWNKVLSAVQRQKTIESAPLTEHVSIAKLLCGVCCELIDFSSELSLFNERVSSELCNQPDPVDSVVDDFAVEAQTLANSLILGAAIGSGILALNLIDRPAVRLLSVILGSMSSLIAFGTMTNVSRYKIRNEEARVFFVDQKFLMLSMGVFAMMTDEKQHIVPAEHNPVLRILAKKARRFRREAIYYDYGDPVEFDKAYDIVRADICNVANLKDFQRLLVNLMVGPYHVNSYVQESLVDMYRAVELVIIRLSQPSVTEEVSSMAERHFYQLLSFESRLEQSLQRGPVRWGFVKVRSFRHWDIVVSLRYFYDLFWRILWWYEWCTSSTLFCRIAPIEVETAWLVSQTKHVAAAALSSKQETAIGRFLSREIRDFETFYWATRESDVASLIFVSACLTFTTSFVFIGARIANASALNQLVLLSAAVSSIGALLGIFHLVRKSAILIRLWIILWCKERKFRHAMARFTDVEEERSNYSRSRDDVRLMKRVTMTQLLLTFARFLTVCAASTAFCLSLVNNVVENRLFPEKLPFWIAMGALLTAIGSVLFFFVVEYVVRYKLPTQLGPFVCSLFHEEVDECFQAMQPIAGHNRVDSQHWQDVATWEYTARLFLHRYRFDTVLAADRFGQILQYLQSYGYHTRPSPEKEVLDPKMNERRFSI